jgi:hypothetical protein
MTTAPSADACTNSIRKFRVGDGVAAGSAVDVAATLAVVVTADVPEGGCRRAPEG